MKKILHLTIAGLAWLAVLAAPQARAWTYQSGDVLLIFRGTSPADDVEFDIGSVNQFLGHPDGYSAVVTGWDPTLVSNTFGSVGNASSVILTASTSSSAWLSSSPSVASVSDVSRSTFIGELYGIIDSVGTSPTNYGETVAETNAYVIAELGDTTEKQVSLASYFYIVTGGGIHATYIADFGGNSPFDVQGVVPGTLGFWEIQPSGAPQPSASYIGTFTIDASGDLTFVAGPAVMVQPPTIEGITRSGDVSTVSFTTQSSGNYSLVYTNALGAAVSTWPVVSGPVAGNGATQSLNHTNSSDTAGFYGVLRSP